MSSTIPLRTMEISHSKLYIGREYIVYVEDWKTVLDKVIPIMYPEKTSLDFDIYVENYSIRKIHNWEDLLHSTNGDTYSIYSKLCIEQSTTIYNTVHFQHLCFRLYPKGMFMSKDTSIHWWGTILIEFKKEIPIVSNYNRIRKHKEKKE